MKKYDVAAYVWPSYTGDEIRARQFWPQGFGEWETVINMKPKFDGHLWPRKPLWGYVNEADPRVMEMQIEAAVSHGVNVFIYDWYWYDRRPFLENCLNEGFLGAANNHKMKFYLMWANHNVPYMWDKRNSHIENWTDEAQVFLGCQDRVQFEIIAHRIIEKYFSRPNYYKIDGRPVFSVYDTWNLVRGLGGIKDTRKALDWFRAETVKAGFPGLHLQSVLYGTGFKNTLIDPGLECEDTVKALGFDSATHYQTISFTQSDKRCLDFVEQLNDAVVPAYARAEKECAVPYLPHVSLGWDNNLRYEKLRTPIVINNTPENVEKALRMAKEYLDKHPNLTPLVTVNSWNEWTEDSYLQPDDLRGYGYLEAVKKVFGTHLIQKNK